MITHYDMLTGEVIDDSSPEARNDHPTQTHPEAQLRLLSVAEAQLCEQRTAACAAGVLMLPIDQLLGS